MKETPSFTSSCLFYFSESVSLNSHQETCPLWCHRGCNPSPVTSSKTRGKSRETSLLPQSSSQIFCAGGCKQRAKWTSTGLWDGNQCISIIYDRIFFQERIYCPTIVDITLVGFHSARRSYFGTRTALHIISVWAVRMFSDLLEILSAKVSKVLITYPLTKAADELHDAQVRDCRVNLCTVSVRWVMSGCWAWCLMDSSVRTCSGRGRVTEVYMSWRWASEWELTDTRVSQYPCLWLRFHKLTASWLSLLFLRSPWASSTPNKEKAKEPCLRTLCCWEDDEEGSQY